MKDQQLNLFNWGGLCHCFETIGETGAACSVCRIEQMLDYNYCENILNQSYEPEEIPDEN